MGQNIFRVYGEDTFAHETFMVGEFKSRSEADAKVAECRRSVLNQPQELRDTFWVTEMTPQQAADADRREAEQLQALWDARSYDEDMLKLDIGTLLEDIREQIGRKPLCHSCGINVHDARSCVRNASADVCYTQIVMYVDSYETGNSDVNVEVYFEDGRASNVIEFFKSDEQLNAWLSSDEAASASLSTIDNLIDMYFDD